MKFKIDSKIFEKFPELNIGLVIAKNIYNYISIKHVIPVGGDDLDKIDGDLELTFAKGNEKFVQLNSSEIDHPKKEEVIYKDDKEVTCRRWNWRECDKSKMTEA